VLLGSVRTPGPRARRRRGLIAGVGAIAALGLAAGSCSGSGNDSVDGGAPTTAPSGTTASPTGPIVAVPASIAADCSVDVTDALAAWLTSVPNGGTARFGGGCFRIDRTIILTDRIGLTIDGGGATFRAGTPTGDGTPVDHPSRAARTRAQWRLTGGRQIHLENLTIQGANQSAGTGDDAYIGALEAQHGVDIGGTQQVEIDHVTINDVYGDFIYFGPAPAKAGAAAVFSSGRVHDSTMARNGRQGISITGGDGIQIDHNSITDTRRATFDLEPNGPQGWGVQHVEIDHNQIGAGRLNLVSMAGSGPVHDVRITDNTLQRTLTVVAGGSGSGARTGLTIANNHSDTPLSTSADAAIRIQGVDDVTVTGNAQPLAASRGTAGVSLASVIGGVVSGNSFINASRATAIGTDASQVTSCGNQLAAQAPFDRDQPCPPGSTGTVPTGTG
jgi:hypothetical protein